MHNHHLTIDCKAVKKIMSIVKMSGLLVVMVASMHATQRTTVMQESAQVSASDCVNYVYTLVKSKYIKNNYTLVSFLAETIQMHNELNAPHHASREIALEKVQFKYKYAKIAEFSGRALEECGYWLKHITLPEQADDPAVMHDSISQFIPLIMQHYSQRAEDNWVNDFIDFAGYYNVVLCNYESIFERIKEDRELIKKIDDSFRDTDNPHEYVFIEHRAMIMGMLGVNRK